MAGYDARNSFDREFRGMMRKVRLVVGLLILLLLAFRFVVGAAVLRDDGMSPAYKSGRPVAFLRAGYSARRGDLVCLHLPDGSVGLRRVIATAGDAVEVRDGVVFINGYTERGSYSFTRTDARPGGPAYPLLLQEGELFVLGDAREGALDSRLFGPVREEKLLGRLLF